MSIKHPRAAMSESSATDLLERVKKAGAELYLYYGTLVLRPDGKVPPTLRAEVLERAKEIKAALMAKMAESRAARGSHKWVIRLGDTAAGRNGIARPAYLACGPEGWCVRMVKQSRELSDPANKYEKARWLILEQDEVGAAIKDERGIMVASSVVLPDDMSLGGPAGSKAEILSACESCMIPAISSERAAEITKSDED